ncbi:hypothetical protein F441_16405 [Phytophthora nicotianae CJ01A1]|uniref:Uncharacterized protein n=1 Tax=Phytophthora nicotianae CJ01A1 TaxID=1317063 RepID=W2W9P2_PHYNI|nr:hypothetical protein F441_16405 [Phytophthora nicotianae CJ01A1]
MAGGQFSRNLPLRQQTQQEDRAANPRSTYPKTRQELEKQRELGPKIEPQPEAWRKVPQRSTRPALVVARDSWEEKFQPVFEGSLQKKAVQTNDRCRPDEPPYKERELMNSWTKIGSQDGETYLQACRVTTSVWKKRVIRTVQSMVESAARTGFPTRYSRTVVTIWK